MEMVRGTDSLLRSLASGSFFVRFFTCILLLFFQKISGQSFRVSNSSGISRKAAEVVLTREILRNFMEIPAVEIPVLYVDDKAIPSQTDDITKDGIWDELAFQLDIERNSSVSVKVKWLDAAKTPAFGPRVRCLLGVRDPGKTQFQVADSEMMPEDLQAGKKTGRYLLEGPVWESEKIAFRHFFDERNFTSLLLKKYPGFITDSVDLSGSTASGKVRGADATLLPDTGLGAGGFALISSSGNWELPSKAGSIQFRLLAKGPVRTIFDLQFEDWSMEDNLLNVRRRVSIWAGKSYYKNELVISGFSGELETVLGISSPPGTAELIKLPAGRNYAAAYWRKPIPEDQESTLSLGIILPENQVDGIAGPVKGKEGLPARSSFGKFRVRSGQTLEFLVFAAREKQEDMTSNLMEFRNLMQTELDCLGNPLTITR